MEKNLYVAPVAKIHEMEFEENILSGPGSGYNTNGNAGNDMTEDVEYTYSF